MATYLLVWNPKKWHWWDELTDVFDRRRGKYVVSWSTGKSRSILPGDRLFLIRLGKELRGIVASGIATEETKLRRHWDKREAKRGKTAFYVRGEYEILLNPARQPILTIDQLRTSGLVAYNWSPRASGVRIPDDVATRLEEVWRRLNRTPQKPRVVVEVAAVEGLRTEVLSYIRGRSRTLRDSAFANSGGVCEACSVDYSKLLDGKGVRVLQVHHKKQMAATDRPRLTRTSDLAVVCANCHALVHMNPEKALPIEQLRLWLKHRPRRGA